MQTAQDVTALIGNTPLLHLKQVSEQTGCTILGKAEFLNPGGSVKDRTALGIIRDAEQRGELQPGGTIVEGTAGNTGIGLAVVGTSMGFKTVIVRVDRPPSAMVWGENSLSTPMLDWVVSLVDAMLLLV